jgi:arylsulfatase A-like enzyme
VSISLNRRRVGTLFARQGLSEQVITLPARWQRPGSNELELYSAFLSSHARHQARNRARAVACAWVRFEGLTDGSGRPWVARGDGGDVLVIPASARADFFVRIPNRGALTFDTQVQAHEGPSALRVTLLSRGGGEEVLFSSGEPSPAAPLDLRAHAGEPVRLSFKAVGEGTARVARPRLLGRPSATQGPTRSAAVAPRRPNILLYVIDTLRADHLGCYGYSRSTSPRIDALAREGMLFWDVVAQSSWTRPATASILTGRNPERHGAVTITQRIRPEVPTLTELLRAHSYRTAGFVTNVNVSDVYGFHRGFEQYAYMPEEPTRRGVHVGADRVNDSVVAWLEGVGAEAFFVYVHASDPHSPYVPPERFEARFRDPGTASSLPDVPNPMRLLAQRPDLATPAAVAQLESLYDAEIAFVDASFGQLVEALRRLRLYDSTIIIVTADHGEEFKDHGGFEHGHTVYRELTRVPLILKPRAGEEGKGKRIHVQARQIDILPTVLDYAGIPGPADIDGRNLRGLPTTGRPPMELEAFTQTRLGAINASAVVTPSWKVIARTGGRRPRVEVYDLVADPAETRDLAAEEPILVGYGLQTLARWTAARPRGISAKAIANEFVAPPEIEERLRALGYVN